jgi:hypothetical protein
MRKEVSGVASTLSIARLAGPGNAANTNPSMANSSPSATRNSDIGAGFGARRYFLPFSRDLPAGSAK